MTLTEFLLERIADEERFLTEFLPGGINGTTAAIAGSEAKRRIVDALDPDDGDAQDRYDYGVQGWTTLCLLAQPYADHPDYREEWKP